MIFKFGADGSQYSRTLNTMRGQTKKFSGSIKGLLRGAFAFAGVAGFKSVIEGMVETKRAADRLGVGVEMFQRLAYAAKQTGVDSERLADAMKDLDVKLQDGILRGGSFAELMDELGLSMQDMVSMSPDERLLTFSDAIQKASGSLSRFGADEFGDAMYELLPLLEMGSEGILELGDNATVASNAQIKAAEKAQRFVDGHVANMVAQLTVWMGNALQLFEFLVTGAAAAVMEIGNLYKPLGKLILVAMNPTLWVTQGKKAYEELAKAAGESGGKISDAMNDIIDEQLAAEKEEEKEPSGITDAEKARTKAKLDAAKKTAAEIDKVNQKAADEQNKREEKALSNLERLKKASEDRLAIEKEISALDTFESKNDLELAKKGYELQKAITKESEAEGDVKSDAMDLFTAGLSNSAEFLQKQAEAATEIKELEPAADPQTSIIASSLAAIGGGGGVAAFSNDPLFNESKKQTSLLGQLVKLQGGTLDGGTTINPEL